MPLSIALGSASPFESGTKRGGILRARGHLLRVIYLGQQKTLPLSGCTKDFVSETQRQLRFEGFELSTSIRPNATHTNLSPIFRGPPLSHTISELSLSQNKQNEKREKTSWANHCRIERSSII